MNFLILKETLIPMPKTKDALVRYRIINRCLLDYKYVGISQLMDVCYRTFDHEVSRRTLEKDIHDMRYDNELGYYAPIKFDHDYGSYFYENPDYSIDKLPLDHADLEALSFASAVLDQYGSIGIFSTFSGAVQKIMNTMRIRRQMENKEVARYVDLENFPVIGGQELLPVILDAILKHKVLSLEHQRFDADEIHHHVVHPYYLKEYRNRWYLVGYQSDKMRIQTYGIERIKALTVMSLEHFIETPFDPQAYYRNAIGVIVYDEQPADILLKFSARQGMYLLTQPIHESQQLLEQTKDHMFIGLHLVPAYELISMILGWGADVEVIKPGWLRERIAGMLKETIKQYERI
jgi:predicted DNA-binding transcriptional regulator YafY